MSKKLHKLTNDFRIIAGQWRSRRLSLEPNAQLRPTPDRVRETLFNWLGQDIVQARCLDLFAGSGALGFEALSRGAAYCDFVEIDRGATDKIRKNMELLNISANTANIHQESALKFLQNQDSCQYDVIFIDPPFHQNMITPLIPVLTKQCASGVLLYIEIEKKNILSGLPDNWSIIREKTAGQVRYHLLRIE